VKYRGNAQRRLPQFVRLALRIAPQHVGELADTEWGALMSERSEPLELLRSIVAEVIEKPLPPITLETPISELGIDSIEVAEIVLRIEDRFGIEIPAATWMRLRTLGELVEVIRAARQT
jgi:acyl carrier protein